jgi:hypothetical protein
MKGQFTIDTYIILVLFVFFTTYLFFQVLGISPTYLSEMRYQRLQSEVYQVSELLLNDPGEPIDWHTNPGAAKRIGLSDQTQNKTNLLSLEKVIALANLCTNYQDVANKLGITDYQFIISVVNLTAVPAQLPVICAPSGITVSKASVVSITRTVALGQNSYGQLTLQMW